MLQLINVSANYGRLKKCIRTRLVEAGSPLVLTWGARGDRENALQSACRATLTGWRRRSSACAMRARCRRDSP